LSTQVESMIFGTDYRFGSMPRAAKPCGFHENTCS
jgi:hypothetical protein